MHNELKYFINENGVTEGYPILTVSPNENNEEGEIVYNIPDDINVFKEQIITTLNWFIGNKVRESLNNDISKLSAASFKSTALLYKIIKQNGLKIDGLTEKEKTIFTSISDMAENGYSDSQLLVDVLNEITTTSINVSNAITKISNSNNVEEIITLANEVMSK